MKKYVSSILVLFIGLAFMASFTGCEKLKPSNLEANYQIKKANGYYVEENYKKAIEAYTEALNLNPELKQFYIYLGTSYSSAYRPGKTDDRNTMFGEKGIEYLKLAQGVVDEKIKEYEESGDDYPESEREIDLAKKEKATLALGDLYDKMGNMEEAEKCYLAILEQNKEEPRSYYTVASFYSKNGKSEEADAMYTKRIELNPEDPEGYHYYVGFLQDQRRWSDAVSNHEKRLYAMLDSSIVLDLREIAKLEEDAVQIKKSDDFIATVKKNKRVPQEEKDRLIAESKEGLEGKLPMEETKEKIEELKTQVQEKVTKAEATINDLDEEKKKNIAELHYSIGNVCWNWSYQTGIEFMAGEERDPIIEKGMSSLQKAIDLLPNFANPYSYMGLLWREKIKVNTLKRDEFIKKNEECNKKFLRIYQRAQKREAYEKELGALGSEGTTSN
ncbi:MAG: tetratricopeptide repeat protein [bacterium]|nr:tetratricopeptide repeat protein [bacterium]